MKKLIATVIILNTLTLCHGQISIQRSIADTSSGFLGFWGIETTTDTGLIMCGISNSDAVIVKTDLNMTPQWYRLYVGVRQFYHAAETPDGGFIALGNTLASKVVLMKCDSAGNEEWTSLRTTGTSFGGGHVQVLPSGDYSIASIGNGSGLLIARADTNGNILWEKNYALNLDSYNSRFAQPTPEHGWIICATYPSPGGICLMKTDSMGNILWQRNFSPGTAGFSVHVDSSGYFLSGFNTTAHVVIRTDTSGNVQWARQWPMNYSSSISEYPFAVVQNGDELLCHGDRYVGMQSLPLMISFDASGTMMWSRYYTTTNANNVMSGNSAITTQDNKIAYVNAENGLTSVWLIKMDSTGLAGCNDVYAPVNYAMYNVTNGTTTVTPTVNSNPWNSALIADSLGILVVDPLCVPLAIPNVSNNAAMSVYPNPANETLVFERTDSDAGAFELIDASGRVALHKNINANEHRVMIDVTGLATGFYVWRWTGRTNSTGKIAIE